MNKFLIWVMSTLLNTIDFYFGVVSNYFSGSSSDETTDKTKKTINSKPQQNDLLEDRSKIFGNSALRSDFAVNSTTNIQDQNKPNGNLTTPTTPTTTLSNNNHSNHSSNNNNNNTSSTSSTPLQSRREMTYPSPLPSPVIVEQKRKTLILDLDETLVHSTTQEMGQYDLNVEVSIEGFQITMFVSKRPYLDFFLESVAKWYDVVVFTASLSQYASIVIDAIDPKKTVKERLYRQSCTPLPFGGYVKDLGTLNKPLSDLVIIDNSPIAYSWHRDWWGPRPDMDEDTSLLDLLPFLEALSSTEDVRSVLSLKDRANQYTLNGQPQIQQQTQQTQIPASFSSNNSFVVGNKSSLGASYAQTVSHVNQQPFLSSSAKQY